MTEENLDDFKKKRELLEKEEKSTDNTIELKQRTFEKEAENIRYLKNIKGKMWGISRVYGDADEDKICIMSHNNYDDFIDPLRQITVSGGSIFGIEEESRSTFRQAEDHGALLTATTSTTGSAMPPALNVVREYPTYFKNPEDIIKEVKVVDESPKQIGYIKSQLPLINPDISKDFDMFLKKYDAFKIDETKYQDFIASRSMLFFKLIFEPFKHVEHRIQIRMFIFGKNTVIPSVEPQIESTLNLYNELSDQEGSVKTGELDPAKVDDLFNRMIAVLYSLLVLRKRYFSS